MPEVRILEIPTYSYCDNCGEGACVEYIGKYRQMKLCADCAELEYGLVRLVPVENPPEIEALPKTRCRLSLDPGILKLFNEGPAEHTLCAEPVSVIPGSIGPGSLEDE
jgi:hypothetical protein